MVDEAFTYLSYVSVPWHGLFTTYSPNHHVLYSILAKACISAFGASEFVLRVPALAGGALLLVGLLRLSRAILGDGWLMLLAVAMVATNPMIFDYLSQARGYSLALGFYLMAIHVVIGKPSVAAKAWAGIALGLSVASNLSFAIPALILTALCFDGFVLPILEVGTAAAILTSPLLHVRRGDFVGGYDSLLDTLRNFAISCVMHDWQVHGWWSRVFNVWGGRVMYPAMAGVFVFTLVACAAVLRKLMPQRSRWSVPDACLWLCGGTLLLTPAALVAAHYVLHAPYPFARIVLYLWPAFVFALCLLISRPGTRCRPLAIFAVLLCVQSAEQLSLRSYAWVYYTSGVRTIARFIRAHPARPTQDDRIAASDSQYTCLGFYRAIYGMTNWKIDFYIAAAEQHSDYIVMDMFEDSRKRTQVRQVWADPLSGAILAKPL